MKKLFQIILVLVILLLITIHQAIAGNTKPGKHLFDPDRLEKCVDKR